MIIELKWDKSAGGAIQQIRDKCYPATLSQWEGDLILAGINYDSKKKEHTCRIERINI